MITNDPREALKIIKAAQRLDEERLANPPAPHRKATAYVTKSPTQHEALGQFEAILATYEVDRDGEQFAYGAWSKNIADVTASGIYPPLLFAHERNDVDAILGRITSMREDPALGLVITGQIDTTHVMGLKVAEGLLTNRISAMSVGFIATEWHYEDDVRVFDTAEVTEGSFVATPAQRGARVLSAKSAKEKPRGTGSKLYRHLALWHGYPSSGLATRTPDELRTLHRELHADGRGSHEVSDLALPGDERAPLPASSSGSREAALLAELADLTASAKVSRAELSPEAQAFVDAAREKRVREEAEAAYRAKLWNDNSARAAGMRDVTPAEEQERERKERAAWLADRRVREGETVRVEVAPEAPESRTRLTSDELMPDA